MINKGLLELRSRVKAHMPDFVRQETWRYKRVKPNWRKPRGIDSKMRKQKKGWPKLVKIGYRGPKVARYLHPSGYYDKLIHNINELNLLDPKKDAARIAANIGKKKRKEIIEKAKSLKLKVLNT
ncbi:MAG: 50S ribosomal protein L32e [Thaumarchaeota archaeon]|nr:50S ribosomal protein L32e [Nitrososphaerota archaeon]